MAIGPFTVIGADVVIGDNATIFQSVSIEAGSIVGDDCIVYPNVVIYDGTRIGRRCIIHAGVVIGSLIVILDLLSRTGGWARTAAGAPAALACAVAQLVVGTRIDRLREAIGGPLDALAGDDPRRLAFGKLHAISVGWLGIAMLAAVVALTLAVRASVSRQ